jgi:hypothetical protein
MNQDTHTQPPCLCACLEHQFGGGGGGGGRGWGGVLTHRWQPPPALQSSLLGNIGYVSLAQESSGLRLSQELARAAAVTSNGGSRAGLGTDSDRRTGAAMLAVTVAVTAAVTAAVTVAERGQLQVLAGAPPGPPAYPAGLSGSVLSPSPSAATA